MVLTCIKKPLFLSTSLEREKRLEEKDQIHALQEHRYKEYFNRKLANPDNHFSEFLTTESQLREIVQREAALAEDTNRSPDDPELHIELQVLNESYFLAERRWYGLVDQFTFGPLKRAFEFWRSHPQWYLHRALSEDCVKRGGCCGRACRCCHHRKPTSARKFGVGHCTVECACCEKARGFKLDETATKAMTQFYALSGEGENLHYFKKIQKVSIWGLVDDSEESPFALIDVPPEYQQTCSPQEKVIPLANNEV